MAQFYTLDEAAHRLGIPQEDFKRRLKLEWTSIRPFRDGATLRFRVADIDELARSLGHASDPGLPLGPVGSAAAEPHEDTPLELANADDIFSVPAGDSGVSKAKPKAAPDSDVRLDLHPHAPAYLSDPTAAHPTEEIALDLDAAGGPGSKGGSSGKLSAPKSGVNLSGPGSGRVPAAAGKADGASDSSSEFELSLDSDSDSFELQLTPDSSEEVDLGSFDQTGPGKSGQSGINLGHPSDSGVSLEKKGPKTDPVPQAKAAPSNPLDDSDDFELSLEPTGASGTKLGGPKSGPKKPPGDDSSSDFELTGDNSSSEFELTLDDSAGSVEALAHQDEPSKGDIFETDFELPAMQDESGSEVVAVDHGGGADGFDVDVQELDELSEDESASQVVLVDDAEQPLLDGDALTGDDLADGASASKALRGVRRDDDEIAVPSQVVVAGPPKWGPLPAIVLLPCVLLVFLGGLMSFEAVRGMWGYHQPSKPGATIVRGVADTLGMKTND